MFNNNKSRLQDQITKQQSTITQLTTQLSTARQNLIVKDTELSQLRSIITELRSIITELRSKLSKFSTEVLTELDERNI